MRDVARLFGVNDGLGPSGPRRRDRGREVVARDIGAALAAGEFGVEEEVVQRLVVAARRIAQLVEEAGEGDAIDRLRDRAAGDARDLQRHFRLDHAGREAAALARLDAFAARLGEADVRRLESAESRRQRRALADLRDIEARRLRVVLHVEEEVRISGLGVEVGMNVDAQEGRAERELAGGQAVHARLPVLGLADGDDLHLVLEFRRVDIERGGRRLAAERRFQLRARLGGDLGVRLDARGRARVGEGRRRRRVAHQERGGRENDRGADAHPKRRANAGRTRAQRARGGDVIILVERGRTHHATPRLFAAICRANDTVAGLYPVRVNNAQKFSFMVNVGLTHAKAKFAAGVYAAPSTSYCFGLSLHDIRGSV